MGQPAQAGQLLTNPPLRHRVEQDLGKKYSPEQIVGRLRLEFGEDPSMRISVETIYQSLYVPSRWWNVVSSGGR